MSRADTVASIITSVKDNVAIVCHTCETANS